MDHPIARDCAQSMGWTSEQVAEEFNISRESQDNLAAQSHQRAFAAQKAGKFDEEILPIFALQATTSNTDSTRVKVLVTADDGIRGDSTKESLAKVSPRNHTFFFFFFPLDAFLNFIHFFCRFDPLLKTGETLLRLVVMHHKLPME